MLTNTNNNTSFPPEQRRVLNIQKIEVRYKGPTVENKMFPTFVQQMYYSCSLNNTQTS